MSVAREVVTILSTTRLARGMWKIVRAILRRRTGLDDYEKVALGRFVALFAVGERTATAQLRNGLKIRVRTDDHVGRVLYAMGDFQPRVSWAIRQLLASGDTVIDVGANIGWFVCTAAPIVGHTGRIEAFEPQAEIAQSLRETVALNRLSQVAIHEYALSDSDGEARFQVLNGNSGAGRIGETQGAGWREIRVQTRNALEVFTALNLGHIRMMKLDVEGHESTILETAEPYFSGNAPDVIIFESNQCEPGGFEDRPTVRWLRRLGYRLLQFKRSETFGVEEISAAGAQPFGNDFIAILDGDRFDAALRRLAGG